MAVYVLTVNGVTKPLLASSININESANWRGTATFDIPSEDGTYRPALDDEVVITENGVRIFGGIINAPSEEGIGSSDWDGIVTRCSAVDFNALIDRRVLNISAPAGTLKDALLLLVTYLTGYGVTLDAAQVNGPAIPAFQLYFTTLRKGFELLSDLTDYVFEIDYNKVLRMKLPSSTAAPFNITVLNRYALAGITVEPTRENFANRVLILGGTGTLVVTENLTAPGGTPDVELNYTLVGHSGYVTYGGNNETLDVPGMGATWEWTTTNGTTTISRTTGNPTGAVAIVYTGHFPKLCVGGDTPVQLWTLANIVERIIAYPETFKVDVLQELADKTVARTNLERRKVTYPTLQTGLHPGMTQTITIPEHVLSGTFTVTNVATRHLVGDTVQRTISLLEGDTYLADAWQDDVKTWGENAMVSGGAQVMGAGPGLPASAAPPFQSVQFNNAGAFGGDAAFTYDKDTNSVICGDLSTITAASHESCQVFGYNCHITD